MARDAIKYDRLMQDAMRGVVVRVLRDAAAEGLPGSHHFLISFRTRYPGVEIGGDLRARYPQDMTIVLQHQFWDLKADETTLSVTLSFSKVPEAAPARPVALPATAVAARAMPSVPASDDGKVVPLDTFRRK